MPALLWAYWHWRELLAGALVLLLLGAGYYVRSVSIERDRLLQEKAVLAAQLESAVATQELANRMTEAIGQIRIRSNVNVSRIEAEPAPKFADALPLPFIAGGVQAFGLYSSGAPGRAGPALAAGRPLPTGEPPGGVLPH